EVSPNYNAVLGGGEIAVAVKQSDGTGGRNQLLALEFASSLKPGETFVSLASDGLDNSDAAGAIVDGQTLVTAQKLGLERRIYLEKLDPYDFFLKTGDLIFTGPTGANVADLMLLLRE
ncbi:MAG: MOFRL family protein, partial [Patescibacteria group bacterium]